MEAVCKCYMCVCVLWYWRRCIFWCFYQRVPHPYTYREEKSEVDAISDALFVGLYILWIVVVIVNGIAVVVAWLVVTSVVVTSVVFVIAAVVITVVRVLAVVVVEIAFAVFVGAEWNFLSVGVSQVGVVSSLRRRAKITLTEVLRLWFL